MELDKRIREGRQPYLTKLEELMIARQSLVKANIITEKESDDILKLLDNIYRIVLKNEEPRNSK